MATAPFHVVIVGGGVGGLCLAQGLRQAGLSVAVYERDRTPTARLQGYRLHISPAGAHALRACLPPPAFDAFLATSGKGNRAFSFYDERLRELLAFDFGDALPPDPADRHHSVSRITLRQVLLMGLDDVVRFDKTFTHYELLPSGEVTAHFADGETATGTVLVGADGVGSRVRKQRLPHAPVVDTGVIAVGGKVPLTDPTRALLPPRLFDGPALVSARGGFSLFLAVQEFARRPAGVGAIGGNDRPGALGLLEDNTADYVMWGFGARRAKYPLRADPAALDGAALQAVVLGLCQGWHPRLRRLVAAADPTTITAFPIRTSVPIGDWETRPITLLGDAIHSMTPYRGIGANTALRDAERLCAALVAAARREQPLLRALHAYEAEMRRYGFAAVRSSRRALDSVLAEGTLARALSHTALRTLNALPAPAKRWLFRNAGDQ
ncbi:MAG TPA: NAD(P)/FAD-dependent oxidoreductase [Chloroflexota bacterium]|nr:NAD(P)/FAD-dependent oxidoreductase [Chloroflexota bacterium]